MQTKKLISLVLTSILMLTIFNNSFASSYSKPTNTYSLGSTNTGLANQVLDVWFNKNKDYSNYDDYNTNYLSSRITAVNSVKQLGINRNKQLYINLANYLLDGIKNIQESLSEDDLSNVLGGLVGTTNTQSTTSSTTNTNNTNTQVINTTNTSDDAMISYKWICSGDGTTSYNCFYMRPYSKFQIKGKCPVDPPIKPKSGIEYKRGKLYESDIVSRSAPGYFCGYTPTSSVSSTLNTAVNLENGKMQYWKKITKSKVIKENTIFETEKEVNDYLKTKYGNINREVNTASHPCKSGEIITNYSWAYTYSLIKTLKYLVVKTDFQCVESDSFVHPSGITYSIHDGTGFDFSDFSKSELGGVDINFPLASKKVEITNKKKLSDTKYSFDVNITGDVFCRAYTRNSEMKFPSEYLDFNGTFFFKGINKSFTINFNYDQAKNVNKSPADVSIQCEDYLGADLITTKFIYINGFPTTISSNTNTSQTTSTSTTISQEAIDEGIRYINSLKSSGKNSDEILRSVINMIKTYPHSTIANYLNIIKTYIEPSWTNINVTESMVKSYLGN